MDMLWFFTTLIEAGIFIPVCIIFYRYKFLTTELKILALYVAITVIRNSIGILADILTVLHKKSFYNLFYYNWHNVLGFYTIAVIFYRLFTNKIWKTFVVFAGIVFTVFVALETKTSAITDINTIYFNRYTYTVSNLFILIIVLGYFYQLLQDLNVENITKFSYFWMGVGLLLYFGGSLFVYLFLINAKKDTAQISWIINTFLSLLLYIAISFTFWYSNLLSNKDTSHNG